MRIFVVSLGFLLVRIRIIFRILNVLIRCNSSVMIRIGIISGSLIIRIFCYLLVLLIFVVLSVECGSDCMVVRVRMKMNGVYC